MPVRRQLAFGGTSMSAADLLPDPGGDYGEVFTRAWVVDLILDLAGYRADRDLGSMVVVEPSCGTGAFLGAIVDRLIESSVGHGRDLRSLKPAVRAFDVLEANAQRARKAVSLQLQRAGLARGDADEMARSWITTGDFLLDADLPAGADFVVGNPPYIRLENVPHGVMAAYRQAWPTMCGRSDIYVGFIERGLSLLNPDGALGFICADRWMRNQYGRRLRDLIGGTYAVETVISMHDVDAFEDDVSAYPAVVVLRNRPQGDVAVVDATAAFGPADAAKVSAWVQRRIPVRPPAGRFEAARLDRWFPGAGLWPSGSPARLACLAELERRFPPLQDASTGTRVGIGVATGCDDVYVTTRPDVVEEDRLVPLLRSSDTASGTPCWSGMYLVSPWDDDGLVDLGRYPRLRRYFEQYGGRLRARHVAQRRPDQWYRTIDRVSPGLLSRPKLVLPDIKAQAHPVLDDGQYYPHHNLYYVVSDAWDLEVLGGLLLSEVANLFVGSYCVKMRGGCYRFQAQYLRTIRVPPPGSVAPRDRRALARAFVERDAQAATAAALRVYGLDALPRAS